MTKIPNFLKPENIKPLTPIQKKLDELTQKYIEHFGSDFTTEPAPYSIEDWVEILTICLNDNILVEDLLEGEVETVDREPGEGPIILTEESRLDEYKRKKTEAK